MLENEKRHSESQFFLQLEWASNVFKIQNLDDLSGTKKKCLESLKSPEWELLFQLQCTWRLTMPIKLFFTVFDYDELNNLIAEFLIFSCFVRRFLSDLMESH